MVTRRIFCVAPGLLSFFQEVLSDLRFYLLRPGPPLGTPRGVSLLFILFAPGRCALQGATGAGCSRVPSSKEAGPRCSAGAESGGAG